MADPRTKKGKAEVKRDRMVSSLLEFVFVVDDDDEDDDDWLSSPDVLDWANLEWILWYVW